MRENFPNAMRLLSGIRRRWRAIAVGIAATAVALTPVARTEVWRALTVPFHAATALHVGVEIMTIEQKVVQQCEMTQRCPDEPAFREGLESWALDDPRRVLDPWRRPYLYRRLVHPEGYQIICRGPDGLLFTADDVIVQHQYPPTPRPSSALSAQ